MGRVSVVLLVLLLCKVLSTANRGLHTRSTTQSASRDINALHLSTTNNYFNKSEEGNRFRQLELTILINSINIIQRCGGFSFLFDCVSVRSTVGTVKSLDAYASDPIFHSINRGILMLKCQDIYLGTY